MDEEKYIKRCLDLAKKALGYTSPNPLVGAVLVYKDKIIGEGYHTTFGGPHAEVEAINDAIRKGNENLIKKSTLYVNLEPCCHWGKTPPCVDKILQFGIKKVVCSMFDPNPKVKGKGIKKLRLNGVECEVGILEKEAKELNKFYIKWITKKLPYITIKSAITLDGKIATKTGDSKWISSELSRKYVHQLRSIYDAVLVGVNTVLKDNPELTTHDFGRNPLRVVVGDISKLAKNGFEKYKIFSDNSKTVIFTKKNRFTNLINKKFRNVEIFEFRKKFISFEKIFSILANLNISSVLVEGGGETIWYLLKEKLIDDFILFVSPKIFGGKDAKTFVEGEGVKFVKDAFKVKIENVEFISEDLVLKAKILNKS